jgi:hypothetical protein
MSDLKAFGKIILSFLSGIKILKKAAFVFVD